MISSLLSLYVIRRIAFYGLTNITRSSGEMYDKFEYLIVKYILQTKLILKLGGSRETK